MNPYVNKVLQKNNNSISCLKEDFLGPLSILLSLGEAREGIFVGCEFET
jgi:hypothetical protein